MGGTGQSETGRYTCLIQEGEVNMLGTILVILLILLLIGALPVWPYSRSWGYGGTGLLGFLLLLALIGLLLGWF